MDKLNQGDKEPGTNRTVVTTTLTSSALVTMATVGSSTPACTQAPSTSLSIVPPQRQTVQVIQQTIHRPSSMAAQYLQQMYAAQRQHIMLQTAALQQQQQAPQLQSLATIQQASIIGRRPTSSLPSSADGIVSPPHSITIPAPPVSAQLIGRTQGSSSTSVGGTISQQAMLLGNRPQNCNQAQMYLRTQMLILTPAATVAAVQSDLPVVSSCSSQTTSSPMQSLALGGHHLPGALAAAHSVLLKPSCQAQALASASSLPKMAICPLKVSQQANGSSDTGGKSPDRATPFTKEPHTVTPGSPVQPRPPIKQPCPPKQQGANHQLVLHQAAGRAVSHRQLQPIALRAAHPLSLSFKPPANPTRANVDPTDTSVQPRPPPLVATPQRRTSHPPSHGQPAPPPRPLVLPRLPRNPPASLQRLSLHSAQALTVQADRALAPEGGPPVAEGPAHMPYQHQTPPQTVAVDLKVHPVRHTEAVPSTQNGKVNGLSSWEKKQESFPSPERDDRTSSTPPGSSPSIDNSTDAMALSYVASHSEAQLPEVEPTLDGSPRHSPPHPPPLPPPSSPGVVRGLSSHPSATASLPGSPDGLLRPHILTHLIEGFVVREGLEPFPVGPPSLLGNQQASLPESQERLTNGDAASEESTVDAEPTDSSDSEMENDAADEPRQSVTDVLQCEFCGVQGYAHTFLRSKRFCSMTCVRRFNVSCSKRISTLRVDRTTHWGVRLTGRRGRPPRRVNGGSREHFLKQCSSTSEVNRRGSLSKEEDKEEDGSPVPMTTRRRQAEQEREREREQRVAEANDGSDKEDKGVSCPSQWNVEQVFAFISSLPGGQNIARDFLSQEIDGQALLLLTEDHLVSTMHLKLGPALKLCAHINSLKEP